MKTLKTYKTKQTQPNQGLDTLRNTFYLELIGRLAGVVRRIGRVSLGGLVKQRQQLNPGRHVSLSHGQRVQQLGL